MSRTAPTELRVFISSTFRDLQDEREHLVKKIFPEIRALCRERGVTFTEVDLRWGITEEEAQREGIIRICLEEIDRCRPYFIGILGERYGWVPSRDQAGRVGDEFPSIVASIDEGASITEMEIVHGVLANSAMADHAFFYFRDRSATRPEFIDTDEVCIGRLQRLKNRIRASGFPVRENFTTEAELGDWLRTDVWHLLEKEFPASETPSQLEIERRSHTAFASSRRRAYIPNLQHLKEFNAWLNDGTTPLVISAESGLGKSALAAHLIETFRARDPSALIIEHYVGASEQSGSAQSLVRHVIEEIRERYSIAEEPPSDPQKLLESFPNWLWRLGHLVKERGDEVLVVLDALNQLDEAGRRLTWLPPMAPEHLKLLITVTPGEALEELRTRDWLELELTPIEDERVRQTIVLRYLGEFHKGITPEQLRRITSDRKSSSPLYLRVVAEELRLHGEHETLTEVIEQYVTAEDLDEVFQKVLERMERDYGEGRIREVLSLVWCSRAGLSETEMLELTGTSRLELSRLLFALDYHLLHRDGVLGFFHDYLRRTVEKRYLSDEQKKRQTYEQLAGYFEQSSESLRATLELLHALESLEERERLERALTQIERFNEVWTSERNEALRLWSVAEPSAIAAAYHEGLERWQVTERRRDRSSVLGKVAHLLQLVGAWQAAGVLQGERLALARTRGDRAEEAAARHGLGSLLTLQGEYQDALDELLRAKNLYAELGENKEMPYAINGIGEVYTRRGEFDAALECFRQQEALCRQLGDRSGVAGAIGGMGLVHDRRREYDKALACYRQQETIFRNLGDRVGLAGVIHNIAKTAVDRRMSGELIGQLEEVLEINRSIGNRPWMAKNLGLMGDALSDRGEFDRALERYRQSETIYRDLGDRMGLASILHNIGMVYVELTRYSEAMAQYEQALELNRSIGNRPWEANNLGVMGILWVRGHNYDQALECFRHQEAILRELGNRNGVATTIDAIGGVYTERGEYDEALQCLRQSETIFRELGDDGDGSALASTIGNIGNVYAHLGEYDKALEFFQHATREHRNMGIRHPLALWLDGFAGVLAELVEVKGEEMPEFLPRYVPSAERETWRNRSLQAARDHAEECVAISEELSLLDTRFRGRVTLARIDAAEGDVHGATARLHTMLDAVRAPTPAVEDSAHTSHERIEQRAELHYRLWKLNAVAEDHRDEALRLYRSLFEKIAKHDYRKRIDELRTVGEGS